MRKLFVALACIVLLGFASIAESDITMPYCSCEQLVYLGQPMLPVIESGPAESWILEDVPGIMWYFAVDHGDFPWSMPGYGWFGFEPVTDPQRPEVSANIYSTSLLLNVKFNYLECCSQFFVDVNDLLFSDDGVAMQWVDRIGYYVGDYDGVVYVGRFDPDQPVLRVFSYRHTDDHLVMVAYYNILISPTPYSKRDMNATVE